MTFDQQDNREIWLRKKEKIAERTDRSVHTQGTAEKTGVWCEFKCCIHSFNLKQNAKRLLLPSIISKCYKCCIQALLLLTVQLEILLKACQRQQRTEWQKRQETLTANTCQIPPSKCLQPKQLCIYVSNTTKQKR